MDEKINVPIGGVVLASDELEYNVGRKVITIKVKNCGNRPIQVGSHFHFFEVNRYLQFDRAATYGYHLNIPATTAVRFEPGQERSVELVPFGGKQYLIGFNGLAEGYTGTEDAPFFLPKRIKAIEKMKKYGFKNEENEQDIKTTE